MDSEEINRVEVLPRWLVLGSMLLISLALWGALFLIGSEVYRHFKTEIAVGFEIFR